MKKEINSDKILVDGDVHSISSLSISINRKPIIKNFSTTFVSFGSCFASSISNVLSGLGFKVYFDNFFSNHFSIKGIRQLLESVDTNEPKIIQFPNSDKFMSHFHRELIESGEDAIETLENRIKNINAQALKSISKAKIIILTLGNDTYIEHISSGMVISSALGLPKNEYKVKRQSVSDIQEDLKVVHNILKKYSENVMFIITVSPQRYRWNFGIDEEYSTMDSVVYSNLSKAKLISAVDQFIKENKINDIIYFPSYDITIDELRGHESLSKNYSDFLHASDHKTPNYIINRFLNSFCTKI